MATREKKQANVVECKEEEMYVNSNKGVNGPPIQRLCLKTLPIQQQKKFFPCLDL